MINDALPDSPKAFETAPIVLCLIKSPFGYEVGMFRFNDGQFGNFKTDDKGAYRFRPFESLFVKKYGYRIIAWIDISEFGIPKEQSNGNNNNISDI